MRTREEEFVARRLWEWLDSVLEQRSVLCWGFESKREFAITAVTAIVKIDLRLLCGIFGDFD